MEECVLFYFVNLDFGNFTLTSIILQFEKEFLSLYESNVKLNDNTPKICTKQDRCTKPRSSHVFQITLRPYNVRFFFSHHGDKRIRHWLIQQMTNVLTP